MRNAPATMGARPLVRSETVYREDGVVATRSAAGYLIFLPRALSTGQQLCLVAALWEVWVSVCNHANGIQLDWTIDVSEFDDLPFPLIAVISSIDTDLNRTGRTLRVVGCQPSRPSSEPSLRPSQARPFTWERE